MIISKTCSVNSCSSPARSRGYCGKHYKQLYRHGRLTPEKEQRKVCIIDGCNKKHKARGYCLSHYNEILAYGEIRKKSFKPTLCSIVDCNEKVRSMGFCSQHYSYYFNRFVKYGYSWDQVDRIIIRENQKILLNRNRLNLIKERHSSLKKQRGVIEKEEILMDVLMDRDMDPKAFVEIKRDFEEDEFWSEAPQDDDCDLLEAELFNLRKCEGKNEALRIYESS